MNLNELSPELLEKAKACKTPEELLQLAAQEGYELSEEELIAISGGDSDGWTCTDNWCHGDCC